MLDEGTLRSRLIKHYLIHCSRARRRSTKDGSPSLPHRFPGAIHPSVHFHQSREKGAVVFHLRVKVSARPQTFSPVHACNFFFLLGKWLSIEDSIYRGINFFKERSGIGKCAVQLWVPRRLFHFSVRNDLRFWCTLLIVHRGSVPLRVSRGRCVAIPTR